MVEPNSFGLRIADADFNPWRGLDEGSGLGWVKLRMELMVTIEVVFWHL